MIRLFIVSRKDIPDLDQYSAFVVKAQSSDDAYRMAMERSVHFDEPYGHWVVFEINDQWPDGILLSEFNAG